uniref:Uncharacterized protein n=1 Tax=Felis catus TaxID=9685 RepID=A0ABI7ZL89_FELCA
MKFRNTTSGFPCYENLSANIICNSRILSYRVSVASLIGPLCRRLTFQRIAIFVSFGVHGQRELTGRRRNRDAFQGTGPSLGANPFQGALPFTKKRELSPGLPPASPGSVALPHWTPRGAHLRHSGFGDLNPTPFRSAEGNGGHRPSLRNGARPSLRTD